MWTTAEPVVREWIERNLGPVGRLEDASRGARSFASMLANLPEFSARAERVAEHLDRATKRGFRLDPDSVQAIGDAEARRNRWGNAALWLIALTLLYAVLRHF